MAVAPRVARWGFRVRLARLGHFIRTKPLGATGLFIVVAAVIMAIAAPLFAPYDPYEVRPESILEPPNREFWFGTDILGRDILSRVIFSSRVSLYVGLLGMILSSTVGGFVGVVSAYYGGKLDLIVQRFIDSLSAFPSLLLAVAIMAVLGQSLTNVIVALTIVWIPRATRTIRSVALSVKETTYVDAAGTVGARNQRIMFRHILPNCFASYVVIATASVGSIIVIEASLSFLGVGTPASVISWGSMLSADQQQYFATAPWLGIFPGLALTLVVFGINVFGDALRDILDPRLRGA